MSSIEYLLNTTCVIEQKTKAFNAQSGQDKASTWATYVTVKCRLDMAGAGEKRTRTAKYVESTHVLYMEYRNDIDANTMRVVTGGKTYTILQVSDAGGASNHLELDLEIIE